MLLPGGLRVIIKTRWPVLGGRAAMLECDIGGQGQCGHTVGKKHLDLTPRRLFVSSAQITNLRQSDECRLFQWYDRKSQWFEFQLQGCYRCDWRSTKLLIFYDGGAAGGDVTHKRTVTVAIYPQFGFATPTGKHLTS